MRGAVGREEGRVWDLRSLSGMSGVETAEQPQEFIWAFLLPHLATRTNWDGLGRSGKDPSSPKRRLSGAKVCILVRGQGMCGEEGRQTHLLLFA